MNIGNATPGLFHICRNVQLPHSFESIYQLAATSGIQFAPSQLLLVLYIRSNVSLAIRHCHAPDGLVIYQHIAIDKAKWCHFSLSIVSIKSDWMVHPTQHINLIAGSILKYFISVWLKVYTVKLSRYHHPAPILCTEYRQGRSILRWTDPFSFCVRRIVHAKQARHCRACVASAVCATPTCPILCLVCCRLEPTWARVITETKFSQQSRMNVISNLPLNQRHVICCKSVEGCALFIIIVVV